MALAEAIIVTMATRMGTAFIKRSGQRFTGFTAAGDVVFEMGSEGAADYSRLPQALRDLPGRSSGMLRIGVPNSASALVSYLTIPFEEKFPDVSLTIISQNAVELPQNLDEFLVDVALTYIDQNAKRYLHAYKLYTEEYEFLARRKSASHGMRSGDSRCVFSPRRCECWTKRNPGHYRSASRSRHIVANTVWVVIGHVRTGKWFSVLPRAVHAMIADATAAGDDELEAIPLVRTTPAPEVGIVAPYRDPPSPLVESFFAIATRREVLRSFHKSMKL